MKGDCFAKQHKLLKMPPFFEIFTAYTSNDIISLFLKILDLPYFLVVSNITIQLLIESQLLRHDLIKKHSIVL